MSDAFSSHRNYVFKLCSGKIQKLYNFCKYPKTTTGWPSGQPVSALKTPISEPGYFSFVFSFYVYQYSVGSEIFRKVLLGEPGIFIM